MNYLEIMFQVFLQAILIVCSFAFFYWKESLSKRNLLSHKEELTKGMVYDREIEIEAAWILLRKAEEKIEKIKEEILNNQEEIKKEKEKTPMDVEKIKDLVFKNEQLGYTGQTNKDGSPKYDSKGVISRVENEIEAHHNKITESVGAREYLKIQLQAVRKLIKKGAVKNFEKFQGEEVSKKMPIK